MKAIIDFIVDGERYASRFWSKIPRSGELVILRNGDEATWVEIEQVIWSDDSVSDRQWIQIVANSDGRTETDEDGTKT